MGTDEGRQRPRLVQSHDLGGWSASAQAWIQGQGEKGDYSREFILDPLLDRLLENVSGLSVLDVGCGEGRYARKLSERGAKVTGIDPVLAFIERACELDREGLYVMGSGERLPFPEQYFDIVLSYLSLVDIPDYHSASTEMARVLKEGGAMFLVTISNMASTTDGWFKDQEGKKLYRTVDRYMEEFSMNLEWAGLKIVNYHRPLSRVLSPFFESGLVVDGFYEPLPPSGSSGYRDEHRVPTFQVIRFKKLVPTPC